MFGSGAPQVGGIIADRSATPDSRDFSGHAVQPAEFGYAVPYNGFRYVVGEDNDRHPRFDSRADGLGALDHGLDRDLVAAQYLRHIGEDAWLVDRGDLQVVGTDHAINPQVRQSTPRRPGDRKGTASQFDEVRDDRRGRGQTTCPRSDVERGDRPHRHAP